VRQFFPISLRVAGTRCVVVGGGPVAERKAASLLDAGARLTIISPTVTSGLADLSAAARLTHLQRAYQTGDLRRFRLAIAATDDQALHAVIARDAEVEGIPLNVVDQPHLCTFTMPAVVVRGELTIAISTGGTSPAFAKHLREQLDEQIGTEYGEALQILATVRRWLQHDGPAAPERQEILTALVRSGLLEYVRTRQADAIDRLLGSIVGAGVSLSRLGVRIE